LYQNGFYNENPFLACHFDGDSYLPYPRSQRCKWSVERRDTYTHAHRDCHAEADCDGYAEANSDCHAATDRDFYSQANRECHATTDRNCHAEADRDWYA
jgi:hypothetical protein